MIWSFFFAKADFGRTFFDDGNGFIVLDDAIYFIKNKQIVISKKSLFYYDSEETKEKLVTKECIISKSWPYL